MGAERFTGSSPSWVDAPPPTHTHHQVLLHPSLCSDATSSERRRHLLMPPSCLCTRPHRSPSAALADTVRMDPTGLCSVSRPGQLEDRSIRYHTAHSANTHLPRKCLLGFTPQHPALLLIKELVSITRSPSPPGPPTRRPVWLGRVAATTRPHEAWDDQKHFGLRS